MTSQAGKAASPAASGEPSLDLTRRTRPPSECVDFGPSSGLPPEPELPPKEIHDAPSPP
jgi:hypothetical protein